MGGIPLRKTVKLALRQHASMSERQVDALLRNGWKGLVGDTQAAEQEEAERTAREAAALRNQLEALTAKFEH